MPWVRRKGWEWGFVDHNTWGSGSQEEHHSADFTPPPSSDIVWCSTGFLASVAGQSLCHFSPATAMAGQRGWGGQLPLLWFPLLPPWYIVWCSHDWLAPVCGQRQHRVPLIPWLQRLGGEVGEEVTPSPDALHGALLWCPASVSRQGPCRVSPVIAKTPSREGLGALS